MRITIEAKPLLSALRLLSKVSARTSPRPALECVGIRAEPPPESWDHPVYLSSTDLETWIERGLPVRALETSHDDPLGFGLPCHAVLAALKGVRSGDVILTLAPGAADATLEATALPGLCVSFPVTPWDELPSLPTLPDMPQDPADHDVRVPAADLREALEALLPAVAKDAGRYAMHGVMLEAASRVRLVATDGRRLHIRTLENHDRSGIREGHGDGIIPRESVRRWIDALPKKGPEAAGFSILEAEVGFRCAVLECGPVKVFARCLDGAFPRYQVILDGEASGCGALKGGPAVLHVRVPDALEALKSVSGLLNKKTGLLRIRVADRNVDGDCLFLEVPGSSTSIRLETAGFAQGGGSSVFHLNADYFRDALASIGRELVSVRWHKASSPIRIEAGDGTALVMPITIDT